MRLAVLHLAAAAAPLSVASFAAPSFVGLGAGECQASGVSGDGSTVFGSAQTPQGVEACRWTATRGTELLGRLPAPSGSNFLGSARASSADGLIVLGYTSWSVDCPGDACLREGNPFRWTEDTGMEGLDFDGTIHDASADGSVSAGNSRVGGFRWSESVGMELLGSLPSFPGGRSIARGISADGSVVVGQVEYEERRDVAFRWTEARGIVALPLLPGGRESVALDVSADGSVVVGSAEQPETTCIVAFRWTAAEGLMNLGGTLSPGPTGCWQASADAASADGSVVVGRGYPFDPFSPPFPPGCGGPDPCPFIWDATHGMRSLGDVLVTEYGLDLTGWDSLGAQQLSISHDGRTIVGSDGFRGAWIATVPEPAELLLVLTGGLMLAAMRPRA
jgi:uncharacterized membrane protein